MNNKQAKRRIAALAFLLCFLFVSVFSKVFIFAHADHKHDHSGIGGACVTCVRIQRAENVLKLLGVGLAVALFSVVVIYFTVGILTAIFVPSFPPTPVKLKIRMNN